MHFGAHATAAHEHEPLTALGILIGELHRDAAAERVPDHGHAIDAEHAQQIAHSVRVAGDRIVRARLIRLPVPE